MVTKYLPNSSSFSCISCSSQVSAEFLVIVPFVYLSFILLYLVVCNLSGTFFLFPCMLYVSQGPSGFEGEGFFVPRCHLSFLFPLSLCLLSLCAECGSGRSSKRGNLDDCQQNIRSAAPNPPFQSKKSPSSQSYYPKN